MLRRRNLCRALSGHRSCFVSLLLLGSLVSSALWTAHAYETDEQLGNAEMESAETLYESTRQRGRGDAQHVADEAEPVATTEDAHATSKTHHARAHHGGGEAARLRDSARRGGVQEGSWQAQLFPLYGKHNHNKPLHHRHHHEPGGMEVHLDDVHRHHVAQSDNHIATEEDILPKPPPRRRWRKHVGEGLALTGTTKFGPTAEGGDAGASADYHQLNNYLQLNTLGHHMAVRSKGEEQQRPQRVEDDVRPYVHKNHLSKFERTGFETFAREARHDSAKALIAGASKAELHAARGSSLRQPSKTGMNVRLETRNAVLEKAEGHPDHSHADLHDARSARDAAWDRHRQGSSGSYLDLLTGNDEHEHEHVHHSTAPSPPPPPTSFITHEGYKPLTARGLERKAAAQAEIYEAHHSSAWNRAPPRDRKLVERESAWKLLNPHDNGIIYDRHGPRVTVKGVVQSRGYTRQALKTADQFRGWTQDTNLASGVGDRDHAPPPPPRDHRKDGTLTEDARRSGRHGRRL